MITNFKTLIPALVSVVCLIVESFTHKQIAAAIQSNVINVLIIILVAGGSVWGTVKNHFKTPPVNPDEEAKG